MAIDALPPHLAPHVPKGHRLFYAAKQGALRMDWVLCVCGVGVKLEAGEAATEDHWFRSVNLCRLAERLPLLTEEGTFVEPPPLTPPKPAEPEAVHSVNTKPSKKVGRPKKGYLPGTNRSDQNPFYEPKGNVHAA